MNTALSHCHNTVEDRAERQPETAEPLLQRVRATLKVWRWRHRVRSQLRKDLLVMDIPRTEKDAGLPTGELRHEAAKPFWKA